MILEFKNQDELVLAFITPGGLLNGKVPVSGFDSNKLNYPVKIEVIEADNMFRLYEEVKEEPVVETKKSNKKLILGLSIGIPVGILVIVGIVLAIVFSGCVSKGNCVKYKDGYCVEEKIYLKRK